MSANTEKCADKDKTVCDYNEFRRLRYFHGMLLDDKDFQAEQQYHSGKRRLLNRMLHGSGVVCGLDLKGKKDGRFIEIGSGLALDCSGNEIWVPKKQHIDLGSLLPPKDKPKNADCLEVDDDDGVKTYFIGIRYEEKPTNPVSVYLPSGSCEEKTCENSRYKEGFCIEVVDCCPEKYPPGLLKQFCECEKKDQPDDSGLLCSECGEMPEGDDEQEIEAWCKCVRLEEFCERSVECPECCSCERPCYVVLGQIKVDQECRLQSVCINECRRYVLTGRLIQHLLLGVLAGSEDLLHATMPNGTKEAIPDPGELVNNPIKAFCWAVRFLLLGRGSLEQEPCKTEPSTGGQQPQPPGTPAEQVRVLQAQLQTLQKSHTFLQQQFEVFQQQAQALPQFRVTDTKDVKAADAKTEAKADTKADTKPDTKADTKSETKSDTKSEDTQPLEPLTDKTSDKTTDKKK